MLFFVKDLGFYGLVLPFLVVAPIFAFFVRRKWRIAAARKQEILRRAVLASEEAARAELEAAYEYSTAAVQLPAQRPQCAVCYSPTTTRCARCKAVRYCIIGLRIKSELQIFEDNVSLKADLGSYVGVFITSGVGVRPSVHHLCSGKCQIIHWRQGHKDECHPPPPSPPTQSQFSSRASDPDSNSISQAEKSYLKENGLGADGQWNVKSLEDLPEGSSTSYSSCISKGSQETEDDVRPPINGTGVGSSAISGSPGFPQSTASEEPFLSASAVEKNGSSASFISKGPVADETPINILKTPTDSSGSSISNSLSTNSSNPLGSINVVSCSSKLRQKTLNIVETVGSGLSGSLSLKVDSSEEHAGPPSISHENLILTQRSGGTQATPSDSSSCSFSHDGDVTHPESEECLRFSFNLSGHPVVPSQNSKLKILSSDNERHSISGETRLHEHTPVKLAQDVSTPVGLPASTSLRSSSVAKEGNNSFVAFSSERSSCVAKERSNGILADSSERSSSVAKELSDGPSVPRTDESFATAKERSNGLTSLSSARSPSLAKERNNGLLPSGFEQASSMSKERNIDQLPKSRRVRSSSFGASADNLSSFGAHSILSESSKCNNVQKVPDNLPETASLAVNGGHSLKTSMRKVVQQFKASTLSKNHPLGFGSEVARKNCPKMLFPYDTFVKLYHWDKVELRPCGLINCGNRYAIDTMQSVCLKEASTNASDPSAEETTLVQLIFGGYLRSKIKCMKCQGKSERHERMMDLTVEIHGDIGTLEEALRQFTATEILDGDNKYQCGRCKSYEKAKKKLTVLEAPNILTIALKRFQASTQKLNTTGKFGKLNKSVRFPEILNLAPYMSGTNDKSPVYRLYGVVVHLDVMNAAFSGHYVCYVKNIQGKWFKIDDSTVKQVDLDRVLSKSAYMLLYARYYIALSLTAGCSPRAPSLIRNAMSHEYVSMSKKAKGVETISNCNGEKNIHRTISNSGPSGDDPAASLRGAHNPYWLASDAPANMESFSSLDGRFLPVHRIPKTDSSSDNASLLSCSDEGSCSTESTRDSTSTEEYSEYLFGDSGHFSWNSPMRFSDDSDASYSPMGLRRSPLSTSNGHVSSSHEDRYSLFDFGYSSHEDGRLDKQTTRESCDSDGVATRWSQRSRIEGQEGPCQSLSADTTRQRRNLTYYRSSSSETDWEWVDARDVKSGVSLRRPGERTSQLLDLSTLVVDIVDIGISFADLVHSSNFRGA
ncbi:ubiquitin-specific protease [Asimina triloba]